MWLQKASIILIAHILVNYPFTVIRHLGTLMYMYACDYELDNSFIELIYLYHIHAVLSLHV